jgi:hypothetical protein
MAEALSHTRMTAFRECPRKHYYRYVLGYAPLRIPPHMQFGTAVHQALEIYWLGRGGYWGKVWKICEFDPQTPIKNAGDAAIEAPLIKRLDGADQAKAEAMAAGYATSWDRIEIADVYGIEEKVKAPLISPITGKQSTYWVRVLKLDARVRTGDDRHVIIEHKTTTEDPSPGSAYRTRLSMDGQVSHYFETCRYVGMDVDAVVYDVLVKPTLSPYKATPEAKRRYRKGDGELVASQRDKDETYEDYTLRLFDEIGGSPEGYFQQIPLVRLDQEHADNDFNVWQWSERMRKSAEESKVEGAPMPEQNPDACFHRGGQCSYWTVCSRTGSLEDTSRFQKLPHKDVEIPAPYKKVENNDDTQAG